MIASLTEIYPLFRCYKDCFAALSKKPFFMITIVALTALNCSIGGVLFGALTATYVPLGYELCSRALEERSIQWIKVFKERDKLTAIFTIINFVFFVVFPPATFITTPLSMALFGRDLKLSG